MTIRRVIIAISLISIVLCGYIQPVHAAESLNVQLEPQLCPLGSCPKDLQDIYTARGETCVDNYVDFQKSPGTSHFWVEDPQVTSQGKADDRARQFIYWVMNNNAIDDHPAIQTIWNTSRTVAYFLVVLVAAVLGLGFIIGQRSQFNFGIKIWPSVLKIALALLYITFSAALVFLLIQLSQILMKFFIENLGGKDLFNIYFGSISQEKNYLDFIGCRDLNTRVQEAGGTEIILLKLTNITYYVMGAMILLRKILLWFLLFVSPFLAILFPFVLIRNIGWIWIGVFFQWLFYGPLFALFLGGMATMWHSGIPFSFDFSRTNQAAGYIYPTAINILYGGPAQKLAAMNNGNYVDTFVEYVITLIMLWAVIIFPWFLLRIFRDYCCDGIYAMKNILLAMYDQTHGTPRPPSPAPVPVSVPQSTVTTRAMDVPVRVRLETVEQIKKSTTEEIKKSLDVSVSKLTDIAQFETNKNIRETAQRNISYLSNPMKADTPTERQRYMNIRTELYKRATQKDVNAQSIINSISQSPMAKISNKEVILQSTPAPASVVTVVAKQAQMAPEKVAAMSNAFINTVTADTNLVNTIATDVKISQTSVQHILHAFSENLSQPTNQVVEKVAAATKVQPAVIYKVLQKAFAQSKTLAKNLAEKEGVKQDDVERVLQAQQPLVTEKSSIESTVAIPPYISIEEYEEVKQMWKKQYESGEVPTTDNITTRAQWVAQDTVFITNTLNKLLSSDETLRQQGLDDVGYIMPIFMINNLKGEQLLVYLKAKLEAAKMVAQQIDREKTLTDKLKEKSTEEFVDIAGQKTQKEENTKQLENALSEDEQEPAETNPLTPPKPADNSDMKP